MRTSTALNHCNRFLGHLRDILSSARYGASTHAEILERKRQRIHEDPAWEKVPQWVHERVRAVSDVLMDALYKPDIHHHDLERLLAQPADQRKPLPYIRWQLRLAGQHMTFDEISAYCAEHGQEHWQQVEGAHIWNHRPDRAFGPWTKTNGDRETTHAGR